MASGKRKIHCYQKKKKRFSFSFRLSHIHGTMQKCIPTCKFLMNCSFIKESNNFRHLRIGMNHAFGLQLDKKVILVAIVVCGTVIPFISSFILWKFLACRQCILIISTTRSTLPHLLILLPTHLPIIFMSTFLF